MEDSDDESLIEIMEGFVEALFFYCDTDNYWNNPLDLDSYHDRRTLKAVKEAEKGNKVMCDRGFRARKALENFHMIVKGEKLEWKRVVREE